MLRSTNNLLIIHPKDSTTDFLESVTSKVSRYIKNVQILRLDFTSDDHEQCKEQISKYTDIVFLGHGSRLGLQGARSKSFSAGNFIDRSDLPVFIGKQLLCLSCDSAHYLSEAKEKINAIGFGDIKSEYLEIQSLRENDESLYKEVSTEDVEKFKGLINKVISDAIIDWQAHKLSIYDLYLRIKLRLNNEIGKGVKANQSYTELLYEMKRDMRLFN